MGFMDASVKFYHRLLAINNKYMKQHITQKQWDEISNVQKDMIWNREEDGLAHNLKEPNIGQMIEFLGEKHTLTMIQDFNTGEIENKTQGKTIHAKPFSKSQLEIYKRGGLLS